MTREQKLIERLKEFKRIALPFVNLYGKESDDFMSLLTEIKKLESEQPPAPVSVEKIKDAIIEYLKNKYYPVARSKTEAFKLIDDFIKEYSQLSQPKVTDIIKEDVDREIGKRYYMKDYSHDLEEGFIEGVKWVMSKQYKGIE